MHHLPRTFPNLHSPSNPEFPKDSLLPRTDQQVCGIDAQIRTTAPSKRAKNAVLFAGFVSFRLGEVLARLKCM